MAAPATLTKSADAKAASSPTETGDAGDKPAKKRATPYALEERTLQFASNVRLFIKRLPRAAGSGEDAQQLLRAAAAVGSTYIQANEAPSKIGFVSQIRLCLKEAKESAFWLRLVDTGASDSLKEFKASLVKESRELVRIYFAILRKIRSNVKARAAAKVMA